MKTGVIIIIDKSEELPSEDQLIFILKRDKSIRYCLLDKKDNYFLSEYFSSISQQCDNVNIVNIRKKNSKSLALKAGTRFMHNISNFTMLCHITQQKKIDIIDLLDFFVTNKNEIVIKHLADLRAYKNKPSFVQKLLSVNLNLKLKEFNYSVNTSTVF